MSLAKSYLFQIFILKTSVFFLFFFILICLVLFYFSKIYNNQIITIKPSSLEKIREISLFSISSSFFLFLIFSFNYFFYISKVNYNYVLNNNKFMPSTGIFYFNESIDTFGIIIIFLAYISGILSFLALDTRIF